MDTEAVRTLMLSLNAPCFESRLLRVAFPGFDILRADPLTLYQRHFLLFHLLYQMKDLFHQEGRYMFVHFMRTFLTDYPPPGRCRFYYPLNGQFCGKFANDGDYCRFHRDKVGDDALAILSDRYFYLDKTNFYALDADTIKAFITGTWEILNNYDDYQRSFKILNLPLSSDMSMVKKRFRCLAKQHHPDSGDGGRFHEINRAYQVLTRLLPLRPDNAG